MKLNLKKGDNVIVIAGDDKGKTGRITEVDSKNSRVFVEGVNLKSKHLKARVNAKNPEGGIIKIEHGIHVSNVSLVSDGKPTRVSRKEEKGTTVRVSKKTGKTIS